MALPLQVHLFDHLHEQAVDDAVAAPGAVVEVRLFEEAWVSCRLSSSLLPLAGRLGLVVVARDDPVELDRHGDDASRAARRNGR